jgi:hypothetical protein
MEGKDHLEDLNVDNKLIEWISGKLSVRVWTVCNWLRIETSGRLL